MTCLKLLFCLTVVLAIVGFILAQEGPSIPAMNEGPPVLPSFPLGTPGDMPTTTGDERNGNDYHDPQEKFFSLFGTRLVSCNYTTQAGSTCYSCHSTLQCFASNVGLLRRCLFFCNSGRCSLFPGSACSSTTTTTTTVATTAA